MKLTAAALAGFSNSCLKKNYDQAVDTPEFHMEWWEMVTSPAKQVAIAAPRRHAKSTAITHAYTLACLLFRERSYAVIVSSTYTQACQFLGDIKKELLENDDIIELFGINTDFVKDTEDDIIVEFHEGTQSTKQFRIQARGSEQKPRGLKWNNKRPDLLVGDDMEDDEMVMNLDRRTKFKKAFYGAWVPALSSNGVIRIVGTILHLDSFLASLMPEAVLGPSRRRSLILEPLKEYTTVKCTWLSVKYRAHTEDFDEILWPDMWPRQKLQDLREDFVRQGIPDVYSQEMLNEPLDTARTFFRKNDFHETSEKDLKANVNYYITADLAISSKQQADYTVFCIGGLDPDGVLQIRNVIRERLDGMEIVETILSLSKIYKPVMFGIEDSQISKSLLPYLNETMLRRNEFAPIKLMKTNLKDKMSRAGSIQARMRAGGVRFDKSTDWYVTFEEELLKFPRVRHDDQVDAFAYLGTLVDQMYDADTPEEIERDEYEEMVKENNYDVGRSQLTGY